MTRKREGSSRIDWQRVVLPRAVEIVRSYDTPVTLRQLFYRLVSEGLIPNLRGPYQSLSSTSAEWRRQGQFPDLADTGSTIAQWSGFKDIRDYVEINPRGYSLDRTTGQDYAIYLAVEKAGLSAQMESWFDELGLPIIALGGYASQSYADRVARDVAADGRPAVLIYAGDFDPSGIDIDRDFVERTDGRGLSERGQRTWHKVVRVALTGEQVQSNALDTPLAFSPEEKEDSRRDGFLAQHPWAVGPNGQPVQVEVDAIEPLRLRGLFEDAIALFWDDAAYQAVLDQERADRVTLARLAAQVDEWLDEEGV